MAVCHRPPGRSTRSPQAAISECEEFAKLAGPCSPESESARKVAFIERVFGELVGVDSMSRLGRLLNVTAVLHRHELTDNISRNFLVDDSLSFAS